MTKDKFEKILILVRKYSKEYIPNITKYIVDIFLYLLLDKNNIYITEDTNNTPLIRIPIVNLVSKNLVISDVAISKSGCSKINKYMILTIFFFIFITPYRNVWINT